MVDERLGLGVVGGEPAVDRVGGVVGAAFELGPLRQPPTGDVVVVDDVAVDLEKHTVTVAGRPVTLTRKEFQVLGMLAASRGAVCTRSRIVAEAWGRTWPGANRTLDVHVATLRTKLGRPELVQTVRGVGYRLGLPEAASGDD